MSIDSTGSGTPLISSVPNSAINLVFVHGAGSNADFWHWQRAAFPDAHYLDLPGHGKQKAEGGRQKADFGAGLLEHYADWVTEYVQHTGLDNVVLNGHSMGGAIVLLLALRRPAWLRGIILTGTGARLRVSPVLLGLLRSDYPAAVEAILQASFAPHEGPLSYAQKVRLNGTRRQMLRTPQAVAQADYEACDSFDVMGRISEISLPTLILVGAQDAMTPAKSSRYMQEAIHNARLEVIEGAGHLLPIEKADEYNGTIAEFLEGGL